MYLPFIMCDMSLTIILVLFTHLEMVTGMFSSVFKCFQFGLNEKKRLHAGMRPGGEGPTWEKILELPPSLAIPGTEYCCSTINSTCLMVAQCKTIFVWKFYDGP